MKIVDLFSFFFLLSSFFFLSFFHFLFSSSVIMYTEKQFCFIFTFLDEDMGMNLIGQLALITQCDSSSFRRLKGSRGPNLKGLTLFE